MRIEDGDGIIIRIGCWRRYQRSCFGKGCLFWLLISLYINKLIDDALMDSSGRGM